MALPSYLQSHVKEDNTFANPFVSICLADSNSLHALDDVRSLSARASPTTPAFALNPAVNRPPLRRLSRFARGTATCADGAAWPERWNHGVGRTRARCHRQHHLQTRGRWVRAAAATEAAGTEAAVKAAPSSGAGVEGPPSILDEDGNMATHVCSSDAMIRVDRLFRIVEQTE